MKFIKGLLISLIVLVAIFVGVGLLLPGHVHVERSTLIAAQPADIFPYLNNFRRFNEWSPWHRRDPGAEYEFSGPDAGVGAKMSWRSEDPKVGSGSQQIVASTPDTSVVSALDLGPMGGAQAGFLLTPEGAGTKVSWSLDTSLPAKPLARWMGLLLDGLIGADYEEGLARLKAKVEGNPASSGVGS